MPELPAISATGDWPDRTLVVRGGVAGPAELERRQSPNGAWSVFAHPRASLVELARSIPHTRLRLTTLGRVRRAGGWLAVTPGPPFHCEVGGLTAIRLDAILDPPVPNPVPPHERWTP